MLILSEGFLLPFIFDNDGSELSRGKESKWPRLAVRCLPRSFSLLAMFQLLVEMLFAQSSEVLPHCFVDDDQSDGQVRRPNDPKFGWEE